MPDPLSQFDRPKSELRDPREFTASEGQHVLIHVRHPQALRLLNRVGQPPEGGHLCANGVHVALLEKIGDPKAPAHEQSVESPARSDAQSARATIESDPRRCAATRETRALP